MGTTTIGKQGTTTLMALVCCFSVCNNQDVNNELTYSFKKNGDGYEIAVKEGVMLEGSIVIPFYFLFEY